MLMLLRIQTYLLGKLKNILSKKTRIILTIWEEDHIKSCIYYNGFIVTALGRLFNTSAHSKMFDQIFQRNQQQNMSNKTANALHLNAPS